MSFRLKTILGIALIEGSLLLLLIFLGINFFYNDQDKALAKHATTIANVFANMASNAVISNDFASLQSFALSTLENPDISYIRIIDDFDEIIIAEGDKTALNRPFRNDSGLKSSENDSVFDVTGKITISELDYGRVELGISTTALLNSIQDATKNAALIALLEMTLVALFSFILGTYLTRKLLILQRAAEKISKGHLGYTIGIDSNDEIGNLANSFNVMSQHVKVLYEDERDAREVAEQMTKVKSEFLSTMSHEIRTPMNGVLGMLHILNDTKLDEKQQQLLNTARSSSEMLLAIINDILDFSKMEAGKLHIEYIPINIINILEEVLTILSFDATDKGIELISHISPDIPYQIEGDPTRICQVVTNFISNAIKFTEHGEIILYANLVNLDEKDKKAIEISVVDTGIGMTIEQQQSVFSAFTQADNSTTRKYGGTGLGLSISQKLVKKMHGVINVESEPGVGSRFSFKLPVNIIEHKNNTQQTQTLPDKKILIVDDNEINLEILQSLLVHWNVNNIIRAKSGKQSIQLIQQAQDSAIPFDVCILDTQLPDISQQDLISEIHRISKSALQLLLLNTFDIKQKNISNEIWIKKPIRHHELYSGLLKIFDEKSQIKQENTDTNIETLLFKNKHILLVDDNLVNRMVANAMLTKAGYTVMQCDTGECSVTAIQENDFDLVLMDIQMPGISGYEACNKIRQLGGKFTNLPIIAMTANVLPEDKKLCFESGMNDHIAKPINPDIFYSTLAKWLNLDENKIYA